MRLHVHNVCFLIALPSALATCYLPNGTSVSEWSPTFSAQPCSSDPSSPLAHVCCSTNRENPSGGSLDDGLTADICLSNGLCENIATEPDGTKSYSYWRTYCTDAEWSSGNCLKNVCTGNGEHSGDGTAEMTPCGDSATATKWCCGGNNTDCCNSNTSKAYNIPVSLGTHTPLSSSSTKSTSTSSSTSSSTPSSTSASSGLSTGAKIGAGIGAALGALALIGVIAGLLLNRRRKANAYSKTDIKDSNSYEIPGSRGYSDAGGHSPVGGYSGAQANAAAPAGYAGVAGGHHAPGAVNEMEGRQISEMDGTMHAPKRDGAGAVELP